MHFAAWRLAEERGAPRPHRGKRGPPAHCSMDRRHLAHPPVTKRQVAVANATRLCHGRELRYVLFIKSPELAATKGTHTRAHACVHTMCARMQCTHARAYDVHMQEWTCLTSRMIFGGLTLACGHGTPRTHARHKHTLYARTASARIVWAHPCNVCRPACLAARTPECPNTMYAARPQVLRCV